MSTTPEKNTPSKLPVVVIGAGPTGLAAAAHLLERGFTPLIVEAGETVGAGMLRWAHVRMFSPWAYTIDKAAARLLATLPWTSPDLAAFPTGRQVVENYLQPLAQMPQIAPLLRLGARVVALAKYGRDRMKDAQRNNVPFVVRYIDKSGEHELLAQAIIDASGTIETPNPLGASGIPAIGEAAAHRQIVYGLPDVLGAQRRRYAGKRVLVVGSGHSAFNVLHDLAQLKNSYPDTQITWALRQASLRRVLGGGEHDQLQERGKLGLAVARLVEQGLLSVASGFQLQGLRQAADGWIAYDGDRDLAPVDEIIAATGFRPDLSLYAELRMALDLSTQSPVALAPLIDPNHHSCGSVRPHSAEELKHPDANIYVVGMKSYGRAPTFLLLTGYEQVRSVVAAIAGDWEAARRVELVLPETGVCITQFIDDVAAPAITTCCATPTPNTPTTSSCSTSSCAPSTSVNESDDADGGESPTLSDDLQHRNQPAYGRSSCCSVNA